MKYVITICFCLSLISGALAQTTQLSSADKTPAWVRMIDDPNTNYYSAVREFDAFWKGRDLPIEEEEVLNEELTGREKREHKKEVRKLGKMTPAERQQYDYLVYQYKRFMNWKREVFPFVQEDGRILSHQEREAIWEQQQKEAATRSKN
jgi:hypothetical protein